MASTLRQEWVRKAETREVAFAAMPDILYVMGTGRSGTTILEVLLTNDPGVAGTGELKHIFRDGFVRDQTCACGKPGHDCELWSQVRSAAGWEKQDCESLGRLVDRLESHANFPRAYFGLESAPDVERYAQANTKLFRSVARIMDSPMVVDSSKYPARALLLSQLYPGKVKVLCLTRSAGGLMSAFQKKHDDEQRPKSRFAVAIYYLYVLLCMSLVRHRLRENCLAIRFEELQRDPMGVLTAIERWSGHSFATARAKTAAGDWFNVGHIMTGNRLRKQGKVRFDPAAAKSSHSVASHHPKILTYVLDGYRRLLRF
jgi:hypothetical protein